MLERIQAPLPYPWLLPATLDTRFAALAASDTALRFLKAFRTPVDPAAVRLASAHDTSAIGAG
jgi:hypothetical protein